MRTRLTWLLLGALLSAGASAALAAKQEKKGKKDLVLLPQENLEWVDLPSADGIDGVKVANITGDVMKSAYTAFAKIPAGQVHPPHTHSSDIKGVIISGTFSVAPERGPQKELTAGGYFNIPAGTKHASSCVGAAPCLIYQQGSGKFDLQPLGEKTASVETK